LDLDSDIESLSQVKSIHPGDAPTDHEESPPEHRMDDHEETPSEPEPRMDRSRARSHTPHPSPPRLQKHCSDISQGLWEAHSVISDQSYPVHTLSYHSPAFVPTLAPPTQHPLAVSVRALCLMPVRLAHHTFTLHIPTPLHCACSSYSAHRRTTSSACLEHSLSVAMLIVDDERSSLDQVDFPAAVSSTNNHYTN
jgi:hypothetical protein